jgi:hypothetical protein
MGENQDGFENTLTSLALIVDGIQSLYPTSKSVLIYELKFSDFQYVKSNFKNIKIDENQIKIDISGTEIVFILENSYKEEEEIEIKEEPIKKENIKNKILKFLSFKKGS